NALATGCEGPAGRAESAALSRIVFAPALGRVAAVAAIRIGRADVARRVARLGRVERAFSAGAEIRATFGVVRAGFAVDVADATSANAVEATERAAVVGFGAGFPVGEAVLGARRLALGRVLLAASAAANAARLALDAFGAASFGIDARAGDA